MPLNEFDNKRQYTKYKRHVNESQERVDANTINKLQSDLSVQQQETNTVKDTAFEERIYTIFNNNLYANAMFVDYFKTGEYIDLNKSYNVSFDYSKTQLNIKNPISVNGSATSVTIHSVHGEGIELNDFFLITNEYIPVGAEIKYYLEMNTGERWPIVPNSLKLPLHLTENITQGFRVIIEMRANALNESPLVNGYAVLYWDAQVEKNYGMTNPDLQRFPNISMGSDDGITVLVRDRAQDDKLVKVIQPLSTVELTYDFENNDGRLSIVKNHWPVYEGLEVTQTHELSYQDYVNSNDEVESVLYSIKQTTAMEE